MIYTCFFWSIVDVTNPQLDLALQIQFHGPIILIIHSAMEKGFA